MMIERQMRARLQEKGVAVLLGMYGMGKGSVIDRLVHEWDGEGKRVVRASCKGLPTPAEDDIPELCGYANWARLHAGWRKEAEKSRKLVIVVEGVEQLVAGGDRLWEILVSLLYYQRGKVEVVLSGTALVIDEGDINLRKLVRSSVVWMRAMSESEVGMIIREHERELGYPIGRYKTAIERIAHGHYGTVKYLCQMIASNKYEGQKLSESRVVEWVRERGDLEYFLEQIWEGYSAKQRRVIKGYLESRGKLGSWQSDVVDVVVESGLWYRGSREVKWRVRWVEPFVREYVRSMSDEGKRLGGEELEIMGKKEKVVLRKLIESEGEVVNFDELADMVAGVEGEYSRWALMRLVARVRDKLAKLGACERIVSVRGVGYRLESF